MSGPAGDGAPTFTPDGNTLFFTRTGAAGIESVILTSTRSSPHDRWSAPTVATFSGQYYDSSPALAPDGSYIVFQSSRPGRAGEPRGSHLWKVARAGTGWSAPTELPDAVNQTALAYRPSVGSDGTLYFIAKAAAADKFRLYRSTLIGGVYQRAEALPFSDGQTLDVDPEIARDGSFLLFASMGREPFAKDGREHLFIVTNHAGTWGPVAPLRFAGDDWANSTTDDDPRISSDGRTLYFSSDRTPPVKYPLDRAAVAADLARMTAWDNGNTNVWSLPLAPWLG